MIETPVAPANLDPTHQAMEEARQFFAGEFGLQFDADSQLTERPNEDQLDRLAVWRNETFPNGIEMAEPDTFMRKTLLAQALMPQRDAEGNITYLFGKGCGAEIALQGQVSGREKQAEEVPYRTHSDFEIYAINGDEPPMGYEDFRKVFGSQEIYPPTQTKALQNLDPTYLHETAEEVDLGGVSFLVPRLEAQFVDKLEKGNENTERRLRGATDAELLASTYQLDREEAHGLMEDHVIEAYRETWSPQVQLARLRKNALLMGQDVLTNATIGVGTRDSLRIADHESLQGLLVMGDDEALVALDDAVEVHFAAKHQAIDRILVAA